MIDLFTLLYLTTLALLVTGFVSGIVGIVQIAMFDPRSGIHCLMLTAVCIMGIALISLWSSTWNFM